MMASGDNDVDVDDVVIVSSGTSSLVSPSSAAITMIS
jgi:hypothetical protein